MSADHPLAFEAWEALAERYSNVVETKPHNALYERPATLSLLPPLGGKRVLDAGCGPGVYAQWLVKQGAQVVGFDVSPKMVALARERLKLAAEIHEADLQKPLEFLKADTIDVVLSSLALDYVEDWSQPFGEFWRVLRRGGLFVFSIGHPLGDYDRHREAAHYFSTEPLEEVWSGFGGEDVVPFFRRPMSAVLNPLIEAGFTLERILEPQPVKSFEAVDPEDYVLLMKQPGFLCVRARK
jgi:SAM-dependent methyltransferase